MHLKTKRSKKKITLCKDKKQENQNIDKWVLKNNIKTNKKSVSKLSKLCTCLLRPVEGEERENQYK